MGLSIKIFIFSAIGMVALAILTFFVVRERDKREKEKNTIFLTEDFFYVNFFGYDGFGECYASLNYELFMESSKDIFGEKADEVFSTIYVGVDYPYNLSNGDKVKVMVKFKGRQMSRQEVGKDLLERFKEACSDCGLYIKRLLVMVRRMRIAASPLVVKCAFVAAAFAGVVAKVIKSQL